MPVAITDFGLQTCCRCSRAVFWPEIGVMYYAISDVAFKKYYFRVIATGCARYYFYVYCNGKPGDKSSGGGRPAADP